MGEILSSRTLLLIGAVYNSNEGCLWGFSYEKLNESKNRVN